MRRALCMMGLVGSSTGCAQLAGIDSTNGSGRGEVTLAIQRTSIGTTVISSALDLTGLTASYLTGDPAAPDPVAATAVGPGMWRAEGTDPAPVEFTLPDTPTPFPRLFAFPDRALAISYTLLEHPGRTPAVAGAMITLNAPLDVATTATDAFRVYTIGAWSIRDLAAAELPLVGSLAIGPITYPYTSSRIVSGVALDRITQQDAFLVARYSGPTLTGIAEAPSFDQTGVDTVTTAPMAKVTADQTLDVKVDPATIATRFQAVRPGVTGLAMNWSLTAAPGGLLAVNAGPVLLSGAFAMTDVGVTIPYGNPFATRGWNTLATFAMTETRSYMLPGAPAPITLGAVMNQFLTPSAGAVVNVPTALPVSMSFNGTPLLADGTAVPRPTGFVQVEFQTDTGMATFYNLQVIDLVLNTAGTAIEGHIMLSAAGTAPKFSLPPEIFQANHSYTLRAFSTSGGYPGIATGDLQTRALPLTQAFYDSAVITVMP